MTTRMILNDLLNLFYPRLCLLCQRSLVEGEEHICLHCESFALHAFYGYGDESGLSAFTGKNIFRRRHRSAPLHERGKRAKADPFLKISWKQKTRIRTGTHGCYHLPGDRAVRHRRSPFAGPAPPEKNEAKRL